MLAYHRPPAEERPAGANLTFRFIEPFRRWSVSLDGLVTPFTDAEMCSGRIRDGAKELAHIELAPTMQAPVWGAHQSASSSRDGGSIAVQTWASSHYQQLYTAEGQITAHVLATAWIPERRRDFGLQRKSLAPPIVWRL